MRTITLLRDMERKYGRDSVSRDYNYNALWDDYEKLLRTKKEIQKSNLSERGRMILSCIDSWMEAVRKRMATKLDIEKIIGEVKV